MGLKTISQVMHFRANTLKYLPTSLLLLYLYWSQHQARIYLVHSSVIFPPYFNFRHYKATQTLSNRFFFSSRKQMTVNLIQNALYCLVIFTRFMSILNYYVDIKCVWLVAGNKWEGRDEAEGRGLPIFRGGVRLGRGYYAPVYLYQM